MYNCVPMHTLQTMQDMQRLSRRTILLAAAATFVFGAFITAIALTI